MEKMSSPPSMAAPWKQLLLSALETNKHIKHSRFIQLATVTPNGKPANRTVVFRGFFQGTDLIQINTDWRSSKIEDLKNCPFAEICWYFADSWEQFRLSGRIDIIDAAYPDLSKLKDREKSWYASSLNSRLQYLAPHPGLPRTLEEPAEGIDLDPLKGPVEAFCLLEFDAEKVDYLNLKTNERSVYTSELIGDGLKQWVVQKVHP
uniref:pyridoxal 5'-phosphate synthase n=1 Tax=Wolffia arrhiza TaxID=161111 RepID=D2KL28_WOLAR|nr:putative pyridoxine 5'-phosphate oxidase [Wolffia arrhiza]